MHLNFLFLFSLPALALANPLRIRNANANSNRTLGHAIVVNECANPIYLWSVGSTVGPETVILPHHNYTETFRHDQKTGGIAVKITTVLDGLYNSAPQTVFAYNLVDDAVWYDLSDSFGDPFEGKSVSLLPSEPAIKWANGIPPAGSQVRKQDLDEDLVLTLC